MNKLYTVIERVTEMRNGEPVIRLATMVMTEDREEAEMAYEQGPRFELYESVLVKRKVLKEETVRT